MPTRVMVEEVQRAAERGRTSRSAVRRLVLFCLVLLAWGLIYWQLEPVASWLTYSLLGLSRSTHLASAVQFFAFEVPKVMMLLILVVFGVGIIRSFFTAERTRRLLAGRREFTGNVLAALLGVVTPFCSCSAVPLFLGFVTTGVPLGVTFSFLISAPMVNEVALVLLFGLFGWRIATLYLVTGLSVAVLSGFVLGRLRMEAHVEEWVREQRARQPARPRQAEPDAGGRLRCVPGGLVERPEEAPHLLVLDHVQQGNARVKQLAEPQRAG